MNLSRKPVESSFGSFSKSALAASTSPLARCTSTRSIRPLTNFPSAEVVNAATALASSPARRWARPWSSQDSAITGEAENSSRNFSAAATALSYSLAFVRIPISFLRADSRFVTLFETAFWSSAGGFHSRKPSKAAADFAYSSPRSHMLPSHIRSLPAAPLPAQNSARPRAWATPRFWTSFQSRKIEVSFVSGFFGFSGALGASGGASGAGLGASGGASSARATAGIARGAARASTSARREMRSDIEELRETGVPGPAARRLRPPAEADAVPPFSPAGERPTDPAECEILTVPPAPEPMMEGSGGGSGGPARRSGGPSSRCTVLPGPSSRRRSPSARSSLVLGCGGGGGGAGPAAGAAASASRRASPSPR